MQAFISKLNEIKIISKEKIDFTRDNFKILEGVKEISAVCNSVMKEFLNEEWFYTHYLELNEKLDITKIYNLEVCGEKLQTNISQYYKTEEFKQLFSYTGNDLGVILTETETIFKVWTPVASKVILKLYHDDITEQFESFELKKGELGTFYYKHKGNLNGRYYNFDVTCFGETKNAIDIYAKSVGTNGKRAVVLNLNDTDPMGFREKYYGNTSSITDAIIYETHIRDFSIDVNSGIKNKGKYLGFIERGTKNSFGQSTGIDHIIELGATHVHLLPSFDFASIDESKQDSTDYNWGYDPQNYNVPEGSYSSDPSIGATRITEFKKAIGALHNAGLGVILDVVYNHTYDTNTSNHEKFVPGYYFRTDSFGNLTNGSGCGNEVATERFMVRKHIVDSIVYWAKEYNIDGFRFDLMGLCDIDTMNYIRSALDKVNPNIIIYGEGWSGGNSPLQEERRAVKLNAKETNTRIAYFSDDIRDGIKGDVFISQSTGFVNGGLNALEDVKFGIVGSVNHKGVDISKVKYSKKFWANEPTQTVTYCSAHDNLTLYDKLVATSPSVNEAELIKMNKLAAFITHISQGALFYQSGEEFARTKFGDENSYKSSDAINKIDWNRKNEYLDLFKYYKGLGELRKSDGVFRLTTAKEVNKRITFGECREQFLVVNLKSKISVYSCYTAIVNAQSIEEKFELEEKAIYHVLVNGEVAGINSLEKVEGSIIVPPKTAMLLAKEPMFTPEIEIVKKNKKTIVIATAVAVGTIVLGSLIRRKKK